MPKEKILSNNQLSVLLNDLSFRNQIIKDLSQAPLNSSNGLASRVFAFWLGDSSILLRHDQYKKDVYKPTIFTGYLCFPTLDKEINYWEHVNQSSALIHYLRHYQYRLLNYYNNKHLLFFTNPYSFFLGYKQITEQLHISDSWTTVEQRSVINLKRKMIQLITDCENNSNFLAKKLVTRTTIQEWLTNTFTSSFCLPSFFLENSPVLSSKYNFNTLLLRNKDHLFVEGLHLVEKENPSKYVVLALAGHFALEEAYLAHNFQRFQELFGTDMVFINHRNYSKRSGCAAQSLFDLAEDVATFARYFRDRKQQIILYGMCGGVFQMILAAKLLKEEKIPYKLLIDRAPGKYGHFMDWKTIKWGHRISSSSVAQGKSLPQIFMSELSLLVLDLLALSLHGVILLLILFLMLYRNHVDYMTVIRTFSPEDILILQARSSDMTVFDGVIHPQNEIRHLLRDGRLATKAILLDLKNHSFNIGRFLEITHKHLSPLFFEFSLCFNKLLEQISDEKLISTTQKGNLHNQYLNNLSTRSGVPISQFIRGFFKNPTNKCTNLINTLQPFSETEIRQALEFTLPLTLPDRISLFLAELIRNKDVLTPLAERALIEERTDFSKCLERFMESNLYQELLSQQDASLSVTP